MAEQGQRGGRSESEIDISLSLLGEDSAEHFRQFVQELKTANEHLANVSRASDIHDEAKAHRKSFEPQQQGQELPEIRDLLSTISDQIAAFDAGDSASTPGTHPGVQAGGSASSAKDLIEQHTKKGLAAYQDANKATIPGGIGDALRAAGRGFGHGWKGGRAEWGPGGKYVGRQEVRGVEQPRSHFAPRMTGAIKEATDAFLRRRDPQSSSIQNAEHPMPDDPQGGQREMRWSPGITDIQDLGGAIPAWESESKDYQQQVARLEQKRARDPEAQIHRTRHPQPLSQADVRINPPTPPSGGLGAQGQGGQGGIHVIESTSRLDTIVEYLKKGAQHVTPGARGAQLPIPGFEKEEAMRGRSPHHGGYVGGVSTERGGSASVSSEGPRQQDRDKRQDEYQRHTTDQARPLRALQFGEFTAQNMAEQGAQFLGRHAAKAEAEGREAPLARTGEAMARRAAGFAPYQQMAKQIQGKMAAGFQRNVRDPTAVGATAGADPFSGGAMGPFLNPLNAAWWRGQQETRIQPMLRSLGTPGLNQGMAAENMQALREQGYQGGDEISNRLRDTMDTLGARYQGALPAQLNAQLLTQATRYDKTQSPEAVGQAIGATRDVAVGAHFAPAQQEQQVLQYMQQTPSVHPALQIAAANQFTQATQLSPGVLGQAQQNPLQQQSLMRRSGLPPGPAQSLATGPQRTQGTLDALNTAMGMIGKQPDITTKDVKGVPHTVSGIDQQVSRAAGIAGLDPQSAMQLHQNQKYIEATNNIGTLAGGAGAGLSGDLMSELSGPGADPKRIMSDKPGPAGFATEGDIFQQVHNARPGREGDDYIRAMQQAGKSQAGGDKAQDKAFSMSRGRRALGGAGEMASGLVPVANVGRAGLDVIHGDFGKAAKDINPIGHIAAGASDIFGSIFGHKPDKAPSGIDPKDPHYQQKLQLKGEEAFRSQHPLDPKAPKPGDPNKGPGGGQTLDLTPDAKKLVQLMGSGNVPNQQSQGQAAANNGQGNPNASYSGSQYSSDPSLGGR